MNLQIIFLILSSIVANYSIAQIPILTSASNPVAWDSSPAFNVDTNAIDLSLVGANQTWTIPASSIASSAFTTFSGEVVSSTPYASSFASSKVSIKNSTDNNYTFFTTSDTQLLTDGFGDINGTTQFTNPGILYNYPFTYNDSVNDVIAGTANIVYPFTLTGTTKTNADAYGTLVLPSGTYNVLRVKIVQNATSTNIGGTIKTILTTYYWYSDMHKNPLMEVDITKTTGTGIFNPGINSYLKRGFILTPSPLGIENHSSKVDFGFYPNPTDGNGNITFSTTGNSAVGVSIINTIGQEQNIVTTKQLEEGLHSEILDFKNYPVGIYSIKLTVNNSSSYKKIIIQ
jgi:hypothetical protein